MASQTWTPVAGTEAARLSQRLATRIGDSTERAAVFDVAARILGHGPQPGATRTSAIGIGLGHVQSGKTTSFTALSALAADNGYRIVIAMLGRTNLLVGLNTGDMRNNLGVEEGSWDAAWGHLEQPDGVRHLPAATQMLASGRTLLITLMKHPKHINKVAALMEGLPGAASCCTVVIDDEADQASLNTQPDRDDASATYRSIARLRVALGPHLYVQYTATPFAPLLIDPDDSLSPDFLEQLTPGGDYAGGATFFVDRRGELLRRLSPAEAADDEPTGLPAGLREALGSFFVSAALIRVTRATAPPLSMLVHPSHLRLVHRAFFRLVCAAIEDWARRLARPLDDPGTRADLEFFRDRYHDFAAHGATPVSFEELIPHLRATLTDAHPWLVNSDGDAQRIDWARSTVHVLVGGNILDRGFVVRGLTTTYITRGEHGHGQADSIEQRARCFGYKASYLQYCRVFLPESLENAFRSLVYTENDMRARLLDHFEAGLPLSTWAESAGLLLASGITPTRGNVLPAVTSLRVAGDFHTMRAPSLAGEDIDENRDLLQELGLLDAPLLPFGANTQHRVLDEVDPSTIASLLAAWNPRADAASWPIEDYLDYLQRRIDAGQAGDFSAVLLSRAGGGPRLRTWRNSELGMAALMQGSDAATGYPGDRRLLDAARPQLHVHRVRPDNLPIEREETYALGLYLPSIGGFPDRITWRIGIE